VNSTAMLEENIERFFSHVKTLDHKTKEKVFEMTYDAIFSNKEEQIPAESNNQITFFDKCNTGRGIYTPSDRPSVRISGPDIINCKTKITKGLIRIRLNRKTLEYLDNAEFLRIGIIGNDGIVLAKGDSSSSKVTFSNNASNTGEIRVPIEAVQHILSNIREYELNSYIEPELVDVPFKHLIIRKK